MITYVILAQPQPDVKESEISALFARVPLLRRHCPGILDIQAGESSFPSYGCCIVLRFANEYAQLLCTRNAFYEEFLKALSGLCTQTQYFEIKGDVLPFPVARHSSEVTAFAYGNFAPSLEERLAGIVRCWLRGDGRMFTSDTVLTDDPEDGMIVAVDLILNLGSQIKRDVGVDVDDFLTTRGSFRFGELVRYVESRLPEQESVQKSPPSTGEKQTERAAPPASGREVDARVQVIIARVLDVDQQRVIFEASFDALGMDGFGLDLMELIQLLENEFQLTISNEDVERIGDTVGGVQRYLESRGVR